MSQRGGVWERMGENGRGRKDLIKKWVFVDLSIPKADASALKPNEEFDI